MHPRLLILFLCILVHGPVQLSARPNILLMIGDDCTYNDLPVNGGRNPRTPAIDQLASEGLVFNRAYLSMSMCNPCRTELYTGLYPIRSGAAWNHSAARPGTKSIVHYLGGLGYRVGISGKLHVGPAESFPFERIKGVEPRAVAQTADYDSADLIQFMKRDPGQPFCLVLGFSVPHSPWTFGIADHLDPARIKLPPNIADTEATRADYCKYLTEIEELDRQAGLSLEALETAGQADNTIVLFTSEQGSQFPGNKWTNWNTGVHTTMIVRWPGVTPANKRTDAMIQFADVTPTLVDAAGGDWTSLGLDGTSFLPVLRGETDQHRRFAYFVHNNVPEGPPYPIRAVTDGTFHYIRNLRPDLLYIEKHLMGEGNWHDYWPTWMAETGPDLRGSRSINQGAVDLINRFMRRPAEEFYQLADDPHNLKNLAEDSRFTSVKANLSAELDRWMNRQGDPGALIDNEEDWRASREGKPFEPLTRR